MTQAPQTVAAAADTPSPLSAGAPDTCRSGSFDLLRTLSVFGVVWFHSQAPGAAFAYAGLPALLILSVSLQAMRNRPAGWLDMIRHRAERLLWPWLFWSIVYGCLAAWGVHRGRNSWSAAFPAWSLLVGTSIHLWYLPFAFLAALVAHMIVGVSNRSRLLAAWTCVLLAFSALALSAMSTGRHLPTPLGQWRFGCAAIPIGCALGLAARSGRGWSLHLVAGAITATSASLLPVEAWDATVYIPAVIVVWAAFAVRRGSVPWTRCLSELSFGVYLLHPAVSMAGAKWQWFGAGPMVIGLLTIAFSLGTTWLLRKTFLRRFL